MAPRFLSKEVCPTISFDCRALRALEEQVTSSWNIQKPCTNHVQTIRIIHYPCPSHFLTKPVITPVLGNDSPIDTNKKSLPLFSASVADPRRPVSSFRRLRRRQQLRVDGLLGPRGTGHAAENQRGRLLPLLHGGGQRPKLGWALSW